MNYYFFAVSAVLALGIGNLIRVVWYEYLGVWFLNQAVWYWRFELGGMVLVLGFLKNPKILRDLVLGMGLVLNPSQESQKAHLKPLVNVLT